MTSHYLDAAYHIGAARLGIVVLGRWRRRRGRARSCCLATGFARRLPR